MTRLVLRGFRGKKYSTYPWSQDSDRLGLFGLTWTLPPITNPPELSSIIGSVALWWPSASAPLARRSDENERG